MLRQNGYSIRFLNKIISGFLDKSFKKQVTIPTVPKSTLRCVLPCLGTQSLRLKKKINQLFKEQVPPGKLEIVFRTTQWICSCFTFTNKIPRSSLSGEIYEYTCPRCNSSYRDSTYRYWEKGLEENLHISALTGKPLKGLQSFAPMLHAKCKCCIKNSRDDFHIIDKEKDQHFIRLKEVYLSTILSLL